jgi:hypothetical protein
MAFMLKAGATEEEISAFQWGLLGNDLLVACCQKS